MKNVSQILSSLQSKPQFSKLSQVRCIKKIRSLLLPTVERYILFAYVKNSTLFFVLSHNAGKQEFDNNIQSIKSALKFAPPPECAASMPTDIRAFVSHKPLKKLFLYEGGNTNEQFHEKAKGEFINNLQDDRLHTIFEEIRTLVHDRND